MYVMYINASNNTPSYIHVSSYMKGESTFGHSYLLIVKLGQESRNLGPQSGGEEL
jgi:hypothetical protein